MSLSTNNEDITPKLIYPKFYDANTREPLDFPLTPISLHTLQSAADDASFVQALITGLTDISTVKKIEMDDGDLDDREQTTKSSPSFRKILKWAKNYMTDENCNVSIYIQPEDTDTSPDSSPESTPRIQAEPLMADSRPSTPSTPAQPITMDIYSPSTPSRLRTPSLMSTLYTAEQQWFKELTPQRTKNHWTPNVDRGYQRSELNNVIADASLHVAYSAFLRETGPLSDNSPAATSGVFCEYLKQELKSLPYFESHAYYSYINSGQPCPHSTLVFVYNALLDTLFIGVHTKPANAPLICDPCVVKEKEKENGKGKGKGKGQQEDNDDERGEESTTGFRGFVWGSNQEVGTAVRFHQYGYLYPSPLPKDSNYGGSVCSTCSTCSCHISLAQLIARNIPNSGSGCKTKIAISGWRLGGCTAQMLTLQLLQQCADGSMFNSHLHKSEKLVCHSFGAPLFADNVLKKFLDRFHYECYPDTKDKSKHIIQNHYVENDAIPWLLTLLYDLDYREAFLKDVTEVPTEASILCDPRSWDLCCNTVAKFKSTPPHSKQNHNSKPGFWSRGRQKNNNRRSTSSSRASRGAVSSKHCVYSVMRENTFYDFECLGSIRTGSPCDSFYDLQFPDREETIRNAQRYVMMLPEVLTADISIGDARDGPKIKVHPWVTKLLEERTKHGNTIPLRGIEGSTHPHVPTPFVFSPTGAIESFRIAVSYKHSTVDEHNANRPSSTPSHNTTSATGGTPTGTSTNLSEKGTSSSSSRSPTPSSQRKSTPSSKRKSTHSSKRKSTHLPAMSSDSTSATSTTVNTNDSPTPRPHRPEASIPVSGVIEIKAPHLRFTDRVTVTISYGNNGDKAVFVFEKQASCVGQSDHLNIHLAPKNGSNNTCREIRITCPFIIGSYNEDTLEIHLSASASDIVATSGGYNTYQEKVLEELLAIGLNKNSPSQIHVEVHDGLQLGPKNIREWTPPFGYDDMQCITLIAMNDDSRLKGDKDLLLVAFRICLLELNSDAAQPYHRASFQALAQKRIILMKLIHIEKLCHPSACILGDTPDLQLLLEPALKNYYDRLCAAHDRYRRDMEKVKTPRNRRQKTLVEADKAVKEKDKAKKAFDKALSEAKEEVLASYHEFIDKIYIVGSCLGKIVSKFRRIAKAVGGFLGGAGALGGGALAITALISLTATWPVVLVGGAALVGGVGGGYAAYDAEHQEYVRALQAVVKVVATAVSEPSAGSGKEKGSTNVTLDCYTLESYLVEYIHSFEIRSPGYLLPSSWWPENDVPPADGHILDKQSMCPNVDEKDFGEDGIKEIYKVCEELNSKIRSSSKDPDMIGRFIALCVTLHQLRLVCKDLSYVTVCGPQGSGKTTATVVLSHPENETYKSSFVMTHTIHGSLSSPPLEYFEEVYSTNSEKFKCSKSIVSNGDVNSEADDGTGTDSEGRYYDFGVRSKDHIRFLDLPGVNDVIQEAKEECRNHIGLASMYVLTIKLGTKADAIITVLKQILEDHLLGAKRSLPRILVLLTNAWADPNFAACKSSATAIRDVTYEEIESVWSEEMSLQAIAAIPFRHIIHRNQMKVCELNHHTLTEMFNGEGRSSSDILKQQGVLLIKEVRRWIYSEILLHDIHRMVRHHPAASTGPMPVLEKKHNGYQSIVLSRKVSKSAKKTGSSLRFDSIIEGSVETGELPVMDESGCFIIGKLTTGESSREEILSAARVLKDGKLPVKEVAPYLLELVWVLRQLYLGQFSESLSDLMGAVAELSKKQVGELSMKLKPSHALITSFSRSSYAKPTVISPDDAGEISKMVEEAIILYSQHHSLPGQEVAVRSGYIIKCELETTKNAITQIQSESTTSSSTTAVNIVDGYLGVQKHLRDCYERFYMKHKSQTMPNLKIGLGSNSITFWEKYDNFIRDFELKVVSMQADKAGANIYNRARVTARAAEESPNIWTLVPGSAIRVSGISVGNQAISATAPCYLNYRECSDAGRTVGVLRKLEDLRGDLLIASKAIQIMGLLRHYNSSYTLRYETLTYVCQVSLHSAGNDDDGACGALGFIRLYPESIALEKVRNRAVKRRKDNPLLSLLSEKHGRESCVQSLEDLPVRVVDALVFSTGFWIGFTYAYKVGDRHLDNIMIDPISGELFHIDFDHFGGQEPWLFSLITQRVEEQSNGKINNPITVPSFLWSALGTSTDKWAHKKVIEVAAAVTTLIAKYPALHMSTILKHARSASVECSFKAKNFKSQKMEANRSLISSNIEYSISCSLQEARNYAHTAANTRREDLAWDISNTAGALREALKAVGDRKLRNMWIGKFIGKK